MDRTSATNLIGNKKYNDRTNRGKKDTVGIRTDNDGTNMVPKGTDKTHKAEDS